MRDVCPRCRRPAPVCYCERLPLVATRTRIVFLQHPRERRVAIGTARMAHLALPNSELRVGVRFEGEPWIQALLADPQADVALLYPAEGATSASELREGPPRTLIVVDGTWTQAKKVLQLNPSLLRLPRIGLTPSRPGNYRIRKEPAPHCLSTVEAVVDVLGQLEGDPERFAPMIAAFERMVDMQIACASARTGPPRTKRRRTRPRRQWMSPKLAGNPERLVLAYAEANAPSMNAPERFAPELVHLVAVRPATGERFEAVVAPRHALAEGTARHLDLPAAALLGGEPAEAMLGRWRSFIRPDDVLGVWGGFTLDLLRAEGEPERETLNLRVLAARRLNQPPGGIEGAATRLGGRPHPIWARGRAGRRIAALEQVLDGLMRPDADLPERVVA